MTSLSLNDLYRVASSPTDEQNLLNAQFVRRELPIRYAHRCAQLRNLPFGLAADERIEHAARTYEQQAEALFLHPKPVDANSKRSFDSLLRSSQPKLLEVPEHIGTALAARLHAEGGEADADADRTQQRVIDTHLDEFFLARIGQRFLIEHYLASSGSSGAEQRPGFSGIIQSRCSPFEVVEQAAAETFLLCSARLGVCPQIEVRGDRDASFTYVPKHIFFVASELLKNAAAATVDFHASRGGGGGLPPVRIVVACGENEMAIKVADEGGGIARSRLAEVWSYRGARLAGGFGLAARSDADELVRSPEASAGLGLPLARLHCKFFGGSLHLTPMEGYGTDSYAKLNRLGDDNCEDLPQAVRESYGMEAAEPSAAVNQWYARRGLQVGDLLYDAQARRG